MSTSVAIFITSDEAKFFEFKPEGAETKVLHKHGPTHAVEHLDANHFLKQVAEYLVGSNSDQWLFLGPGLAKTHLQKLIESKYSSSASKIVGVAGMNKSSDGEITDFAHSFFKRRNLYVG